MSDQVFSLFASFIQDLSKTYPEIKNCLYRNYETCVVDTEGKQLSDCPKLEAFLEIVHENEQRISKRDVEFFKVENILEEISFENLWSKNISEKTRATIWKYFQTFSILTVNLRSSDELQQALRALKAGEEIQVKDKAVASELRKIKRLAEGVQENLPSGSKAEADLEGMLGGMMDSNIGQIAKEVAETMDMESMFGGISGDTNPMDVMSQMMNPEKMGKVFQNIGEIMNKKMESGEFNKDDLKKEAEGMYGTMAQNPMFSGLMSGMAEMGGQPRGPRGDSFDGIEEVELTKEEKQRLLRQKIKAKSDARSGK